MPWFEAGERRRPDRAEVDVGAGERPARSGGLRRPRCRRRRCGRARSSERTNVTVQRTLERQVLDVASLAAEEARVLLAQDAVSEDAHGLRSLPPRRWADNRYRRARGTTTSRRPRPAARSPPDVAVQERKYTPGRRISALRTGGASSSRGWSTPARSGLRQEASRCPRASRSETVAVALPVTATVVTIVRRSAGRNTVGAGRRSENCAAVGLGPAETVRSTADPSGRTSTVGRRDHRSRGRRGLLVRDRPDGKAGRGQRLRRLDVAASGELRQRAQAGRGGADVAGAIRLGELEGARIAGGDRAELRLVLRRVEVGDEPAVGVELHLGDRADRVGARAPSGASDRPRRRRR